MSDLHVRFCDCDLCLPGYPAVATRVYRTKRRPLGYSKHLRAKQHRAGKATGLMQRARAK